MDKNNPKVFVCHASEDKERFVLNFGKKLREKGVDAWVDEWEMKLGDSLVHKIFEEGIKQCDVFMVILSRFSINKPWVREELDSAVVRRIEEKMRLFPVVIDKDIEIPQSIRHIKREPINDLANYEKEFQNIVNSIYGVTEKPPLGEQPNFVKFRDIQGLTKVDAITLKIAGDIVYERNDVGGLITTIEIIEKALPFELSKDEVIDSLDILESNGYWEISRNLRGKEWSRVIFTPFGFSKYCEFFREEFGEVFKGIVSGIINEGLKNSEEISTKLGYKLVMVNSLLIYFRDSGYLRIMLELGRRGAVIYDITAEGRRYFDSILS